AFLLGVAYLFSNNRAAIRWKTVVWGIVLQLLFALFILKFDFGQRVLSAVARGVTRLVSFADEGSGFVFGSLANDPQNFIFAFKVLPIVIFISSFFTMLYYLGIMQLVVRVMARLMTRFMGVSGSESLAAAANVFMGQTEAPIVLAPYIPQMTYSELMALMTGGMATVSGAILGGYISLGINAEYLIAASVMAAPASLLMAKMIIPETETPKTAGKVTLKIERTAANIIDAAARGAGQGAVLAINIAAMLIAFIAIIYLINGVLTQAGELLGLEERFGMKLSMQLILGYLLAPVAFLMGVPWGDATTVGQLIGVKVVINEFVAYVDLVGLKGTLNAKSELIATYALCGFANLSSIGIQIGGIGGLAPTRKSELAKLGLRAVLAGSLASFMTATLAGMLS
ncbi:NupC/NupG family nucleoside CNT transporter, partial [Acidobacteria bacterium AH-259-A15]|nr:NupC/NupG family nucleoside CNT transporter [Acidobacteria bacterium AH-259-A15]